MKMRLAALMAGALLAISPFPARAELADAPFAAKTVTERAAAVEALKASPDTPDKQMALATLATFGAIERFGQALHRHGFRTSWTDFGSLMRLPMPENATPEPLTYEAWRAILGALVNDLDAAKDMLAEVDAAADIGVGVDLRALRFDLNSDGTLSETESVVGIFQAFNRRAARPETEAPSLPPIFRFDRADGYWLQGYANFVTANARMWLAHDFEKSFDISYGFFFPHRMSARAPAGERKYDAIFEFVSLIHTISCPVIEPDTRKAVLSDLKEMVRLSRLNWQAIRAETDNEREWLPGPQQKGPHPLTTLEVTDEIVAGWHEALDAAEAVLDGKALVPHVRYPGQGVNVKRFLDETTEFDLVLIMTGHAVEPFLETGTVIDDRALTRMSTAFGRPGMAPFALWFN